MSCRFRHQARGLADSGVAAVAVYSPFVHLGTAQDVSVAVKQVFLLETLWYLHVRVSKDYYQQHTYRK